MRPKEYRVKKNRAWLTHANRKKYSDFQLIALTLATSTTNDHYGFAINSYRKNTYTNRKQALICLILTLYFFLPQQVLGHSTTIDSLVATFESSEGSFLKAKSLEKSLIYLMSTGGDTEEFIDRLDKNQFNKRLFLIIDAIDAKKAAFFTEWDSLSVYRDDSNPYKRFNSGIASFVLGDLEQASEVFKSCIDPFMQLEDSFYVSSNLTNIGAIYWHKKHKDSALHYFLKAKEYTFWFNEMLEMNILAISNSMNDSALSLDQIRKIHSHANQPYDPVFLTNALYYYEEFDTSRVDSMRLYLLEQYPADSLIPEALLRSFVNIAPPKQLARSFADATNISFLREGIQSLLVSDRIASSAFDSATIHTIREKLGEDSYGTLIHAFAYLDSIQRLELSQALGELYKEEQRNTEAEQIELQRLYASRDKQMNLRLEQATKMFFGVAILLLSILIFILRRNLKIAKTQGELAKENTRLLKQQLAFDTQKTNVHAALEKILSSQIKFEKSLLELAEPGAEHKTNLIKDLQLINTHQKGVNRFKLKSLLGEFRMNGTEKLDGVLNAMEMQVFKLTLLDFKAKEIGLLLDVSAQYVNNIRHKSRTAIESHGYDYQNLVFEMTQGLQGKAEG
jgi:cell division protein FtsL